MILSQCMVLYFGLYNTVVIEIFTWFYLLILVRLTWALYLSFYVSIECLLNTEASLWYSMNKKHKSKSLYLLYILKSLHIYPKVYIINMYIGKRERGGRENPTCCWQDCAWSITVLGFIHSDFRGSEHFLINSLSCLSKAICLCEPISEE